MFIIDLLITKTSDRVSAEVELKCPNHLEADAAEEHLFYDAKAPAGMLFVRLQPDLIRMNFIDDRHMWDEVLAKPEGMQHLSHKELIAARLPPCARLDCFHEQHNAILARVTLDVPTYGELQLALEPN